MNRSLLALGLVLAIALGIGAQQGNQVVPAAAVTGSGTANLIPKFTSGSVLGNSSLTDNGTTVSTSEAVSTGALTPTSVIGSPAATLGATTATGYLTATNCAVNSVSPAACGSAASGAFVLPASTTAYTVNTTTVTAQSRIFILPSTDASNLPSAPTCNSPAGLAIPSARVAGTSFSFTTATNAGTTCWNYWIID